MKKKLFLSSILSIIMCLSLITGATFALFTSESSINIAVTSGNVSVMAVTENLQYKTLGVDNWVEEAGNQTVFGDTNVLYGHSAKIDGGNVILDKMLPGDAVKFDVRIHNASDVVVKYRTSIVNDESADTGLFSDLKIKVREENFYGKIFDKWETILVGSNDVIIPIEIELPEGVGGESGKACAIKILVQAVQGNAQTFDDQVDYEEVIVDAGKVDAPVELGNASSDNVQAQVPAGVELVDGTTTLSLEVEKAEANTGNFTVQGVEVNEIGLNISIPQVSDTNSQAITVTVKDILAPNLANVALFHKGVEMTRVYDVSEVVDGKFYYDTATGYIIFATVNFSNFTIAVYDIETEEQLLSAIEARTDVGLSTDIELEKGIVIPATKTLNINFNGKALTYKSDVAGDAMIKNNGMLTLNGEGSITYTYFGQADTSYGKGNYTITNSGKLVVNGVNVINDTEKMSHAYYAIDNNSINTSCELIINDGNVINSTAHAIRLVSSSNKENKATINGGHIEGVRGVMIQLTGSATDVAPVINLTVNGGRIVSNDNGDDGYYLAIYSYTNGNNLKNVTINLVGGEFTGWVALSGGSNKAVMETVNVLGGTFDCGVYSYAYEEGEEGYGINTYTAVDSYEALKSGLESGQKVALSQDLTIENGSIVIANGIDAVLYLNADIYATYEGSIQMYGLFKVENGASLTIYGNGEIYLKANIVDNTNACATIFYNQGNLIINGGKYIVEDITQKVADSWIIVDIIDNCLYSGDAVVTINGGEFGILGGAINLFRNFSTGTNASTTLNINGGIFKANPDKSTTYIWNHQNWNANIKCYMNFNGGTFENIVYEDYCGQSDIHVSESVIGLSAYSGNN